MKFIKGKDRHQLEFYCLEETIDQDNEVRLIDLFASSLNLADYGFKTEFIDPDKSSGGHLAYHPSDLLRLFLYGYLNRIRSLRHLQHHR